MSFRTRPVGAEPGLQPTGKRGSSPRHDRHRSLSHVLMADTLTVSGPPSRPDQGGQRAPGFPRGGRDSPRERACIVPWVFHRNGRRIHYYYNAWRAACTRAGCPGRLVHDVRRTAVRHLERAGVPRSVAMNLTGHKTEAVYRRYAIVAEGISGKGSPSSLSRRRERSPP